MKPRHLIPPHILFIGSLALLPAHWSSAASGSWSATTGSPASWATAANWGGTANVGNTEGDSATIQTDITGTYTINLNGVRTVGNLTIGDSNNTNAFTLASGTTSILTFDQTNSGTAMLAFTSTTSATSDSISAPIQLNDNLRVYNTSTTTSNKTISGIISGIGKSITFDNDDGITAADPGLGAFTLSGANSYTGGTVIDDVRVQISNASAFGGSIGGTVEVNDGGGVWINTTTAVDSNFNLTGTGWLEGNGKLGTIRMGSGTSSSIYKINGNVTISGIAGDSGGTTPDASIFPHSTSTAATPTAANSEINGVVSGGDLLVGSMSTGPATAYNGTETLSLTNANTYGDSIIKPLDTATSGQTILMIGSIDNTTATLGSGPVYLIGGTGGKTAALSIRRTDGFTLQQDIVTPAVSGPKTALITDVGGSGFTLNGKSITVREQVRVGSSASGTSFNIDSGTITAAQFFTGNAAGISSTVNQSDGTVNISGEVRIAHFPTETSVWNMSGGTLTLTGTPTSNPYFTTGSTEVTTGMGTLYLGIDGQGIFNHTGGTVNAAAVVLDNRTNNGVGTNMTTGVDQYNLYGGTLNLGSATSAWGIQGNASSQFAFEGGTLKVGSSLPIAVPMAANGAGSVLDTNSFTVTLKSGISGSADLLLADTTSTTGKVVFDLATDATVSASLSGLLPIEKIGTGLLTLGGANTFTGSTTVTAGGLRITGSSASNTTVDGSTLWTGGILTGNLSLAPTTNCTLSYGGSPLAVTGNVTIGGTNLVNPVAAGIPASGTYPLITCTGFLTGVGNLLIDPASTTPYRQTFGLISNSTSVSLTVSGSNLSLTWNGIGTGSGTWDVNASAQWAGGQKFFMGDSATFDDAATSGIAPFATLTTNLVEDVNDLVFTAKTNGPSGEAISIQYVVPPTPDESLTVSVTGKAIIVKLATDALGTPISTSGDVKAKIQLTAEADALVAVTHAVDNDGSGFVSAMATSYLNLGVTETVKIPTGVTVSPGGLVFANNALDYALDGPGTVSGSTGLLKSGTGKLSINTSNSFTGGTVISKGEIIVGAASALGAGSLTFGDSNTTATDVCTLSLTNGANALTPITVADTCLNARIYSTGGTIANTAITKKGTGRLTIGDPTFYGNTTTCITGTSSVIVEKGTLAFSSMIATATGTDITLGNTNSGADDTVFEIPAALSADASVINADFVLGTLGTGDTSKAIIRYVGAGPSGGTPRVDGTLNLNGRDLLLENTSLVAGGVARLYNFAPKISGMGNVRVRCGTNPDGSASAVPRCRIMYNGNDWLGDLYVETGMLQVYTGAGGSINCIPNTSDVIISAGTKIGMGCSDTINALIGGEATESLPATEIAAALSSSTTTVTLTVGSNNGSGVFGGKLLSGGGRLALTKTGTGTQTMNGACSHVGNTTVSTGKLIMNGANASSPVIVSAGATLGGNMTSAATMNSAGTAATGITATATGATIAPGNSIGTITAVSVNLSTGGVLAMDLDDTATPKHDQLVITGTAASSLNISNATLSLNVTGTLAENVYVLATCPTGSLTGTFATVTGKPSNYDLVYNYDDGISTNNIALVKGSDPYLGWLAGYAALTGANRAPGADFDSDGLDNGIEFVIGSDPTTFTGPGTAGFPTATVTGGNLVFTFKRGNDSKMYAITVETSADLTVWPPAGAYLVPTTDTAGPPVNVAGETVTVTIPMGTDAKKFARVNAEIPFTP